MPSAGELKMEIPVDTTAPLFSCNLKQRKHWGTLACQMRRRLPLMSALLLILIICGCGGSAPPPTDPPVIDHIIPTTVTAGTGGYALSVFGNFTTTAVVQYNGANRPTVFFDSQQGTWACKCAGLACLLGPTNQCQLFGAVPRHLESSVSSDDMLSPGIARITLVDNGKTSNSVTLTIVAANPVPTIGSLSPVSVATGTPDFVLTINGSGFVASSDVQWNGNSRPTTVVSDAKVLAAISAADVALGGNAQITVFNPGPGGGHSNTFTLEIR
jgi:hypothetical protein